MCKVENRLSNCSVYFKMYAFKSFKFNLKNIVGTLGDINKPKMQFLNGKNVYY